MKITVEFESIDEFEAFKVSGKKTRSKKEEAEETGPATAPVGGQQIGNRSGYWLLEAGGGIDTFGDAQSLRPVALSDGSVVYILQSKGADIAALALRGGRLWAVYGEAATK